MTITGMAKPELAEMGILAGTGGVEGTREGGWDGLELEGLGLSLHYRLYNKL